MAKKPAQADPVYEAAKASYAALIATVPEAELKGAAMPYTSLNGNMFSYLHPSGRLALRLASGDRERFLAEHATTLFEAYGVVQKEYVTAPAALLADTERLSPYFRSSYEYAATLKPKPTKKAKKG
jgi:TfoX/Sxy family transcriptional regulator of competence genes